MSVGMPVDVMCPAVCVGVLGIEGVNADLDVGIVLHLFIILRPNPQSEIVSGTIAFWQGKVDKKQGCSAVQMQALVAQPEKDV